MIRSSSVSLKFSNFIKKESVSFFIDEYTKVVKEFVDILWDFDDVPRLIPKGITSKVTTWLSARSIQCCAKQASGIVRGTKEKNKRRLFIHNKLVNEGKLKKARKLKKIIDSNKESKPDISNICPELDSRFVAISLDNNNSFDLWIVLKSLGNNLKLYLPFKRTKHFNKLLNKGKLKNCIRLSKNSMTLMFEIENTVKNVGGTIGVDIGIKKVISPSTGLLEKEDSHDWNLEKIQKRLASRKKGSKGFRRTQQHRNNFINWTINQLNLSSVKEVRCENIKYLRKGIRNSRFMSHWTYADIFKKLKQKCEEENVSLVQVSSTYTSQRCSSCGWVSKKNRNREKFKCESCGFAADADLNASKNISLNLPVIHRKLRLLRLNRKGFYLPEIKDQEPIVPDAP